MKNIRIVNIKIQIIADNIKEIFIIKIWLTDNIGKIINIININENNILECNRIFINESHSKKEKVKINPIKALKKISLEKKSKHKKIARTKAVTTRV